MIPAAENLFDYMSGSSPGERFFTLFENSSVKIERIVSHSHSSAEGFWYDQADDEWVMVLRGEATLEFAGGELIEMNEGDYLAIPRRMKHRVSRTGPTTIWLAVHVR